MARDKRKAAPGRRTPTEAGGKVFEEEGHPVSGDVPDVASVKGGEKIKPVDLSLHGDGVTHWQDEPQPEGKHRSARSGELHSQGKKS